MIDSLDKSNQTIGEKEKGNGKKGGVRKGKSYGMGRGGGESGREPMRWGGSGARKAAGKMASSKAPHCGEAEREDDGMDQRMQQRGKFWPAMARSGEERRGLKPTTPRATKVSCLGGPQIW